MPTFENMKNLRYGQFFRTSRREHRLTSPPVHAVVNETLRLFPPVPLNIRETREEGVVLPPSDPTYPTAPEPIYLPEQTTVTYLPLLVQKNKALWGEDADEFDPERWLDDRLQRYTENPMIYTPFSAGPRIVSVLVLS
jgi:cytochrome P450